MKKITYLFMLAFMAFSFYSCEEPTTTTTTSGVEASITFAEGQKDNKTIPSDGETVVVNFNSTKTWTVSIEETEAATWCNLTPKEGGAAGETEKITLEVAPNDTDVDRVATIVIVSEEVEKKFTLTQTGKDAPIVAAITFADGQEDNETVPSAGKTVTVNFKSTKAWTVSIEETEAATWCSLTPEEGGAAGDANTITIEVVANETPDDRVATIVIVSDEVEEEFILTQKQLDSFTISGQPTESIPSAGDEFEIIVSENMGAPTVVIEEADKEWIKSELIPASKALTVTTFKITIEENTSLLPLDGRSSVITIKSGDKEKPFTVTQLPSPPRGNLIQLGNLLISDRNLGTQVPQDGVALNYTNDVDHPDHQYSAFKGNYYTWEEAQTACPVDWRLPTKEELESISTAMQFSEGRAYLADSDGNRCYFPLSGYSVNPSGVRGRYWSSTESGSSPWALYVSTLQSFMNNYYVSVGLSVRCVQTVAE